MIGWYLFCINCIGLALLGYDKSAARKTNFRVPEILLLFVALAGASPVIILGMKLYRHKTRKNSFKICVAAIVVLQILLLRFCIE